MRRAAVALAALLTALCVAAPAALADHVHPTVMAKLELGGKVKDCDSREVCGGSRRATVSWEASCGPGIPDSALEEVDVSILGVRPNGRRFGYDGETFGSDEVGLVGSLGMVAGPGLRFVGQVKVTCAVQTLDENEHLVDHRGSATATTGELYLPPRLAGFRIGRGTWCGVNLTGDQSARLLQAGEFFDLFWFLRYSGASLFKPGVPPKRQVKLFARGAGTRFRRAPDPAILRNYGEIGTYVNPRRGGTLDIWATIGGKKTNTLHVKVLPKRC